MIEENKILYTDDMFCRDVDWIRRLINSQTEKFEAIIAPYRGGLPLGVKLSHILNLPLGIINYQRLDGVSGVNGEISLAIEPIGKDDLGNPIKFKEFTDSVLLVDEICDTGETMVKAIKYLKELNPNIEIKVICLYASNDGDEFVMSQTGVNIMPCRDNKNKWVTFPWENDMDQCGYCYNGEPCRHDPENLTHCNIKDETFHNGIVHPDGCFLVGAL